MYFLIIKEKKELNKIRKNIILLFLVILFLMFSMQGFSHPASKITLSTEGTVLHVTVNHDVGSSEDHYINEISKEDSQKVIGAAQKLRPHFFSLYLSLIR